MSAALGYPLGGWEGGATDAAGQALLVVCGPTGAGKTAAGIALAQALDGEIVSADSVQIYRYLDIGSAKPTRAEQAAAAHHMLDVVDPDARYSAARYATAAVAAIADIRARGKRPIVVGGSGLYLKSLLYGLVPAPSADPALRARLLQESERGGPAALHTRLAEVDPETANRLAPQDLVRVVRALEVFELTGRPLSALHQQHRFAAPRYPARIWALDPGPETLHQRIEARVDEMMARGFLAETQQLLARGYAPDCPGLSCVGYRDLVRHLRGELELDEAVRLVRRDHRRYVKRQRTWFRGMQGVTWIASAAELPIAALKAATT